MIRLPILCLTGIILCSNDFVSETKQDLYELNRSRDVLDKECIYELMSAGLEDDISGQTEWKLEHSARVMGKGFYYTYLLGDSGYPDYICMEGDMVSSTYYSNMRLKYIWTGEEIEITASKEEMDEYFKRNEKVGDKLRQSAKEIEAALDDDEYGGIYYDENKQCLGIYLTDESAIEKINTENVVIDTGDYSMEELYETLLSVWSHREELDVNYIKVRQELNRICIYTTDEEKTEQWLREQNISCAIVNYGLVLAEGVEFSWTEDTDDLEIAWRIAGLDKEDYYDNYVKGIKILKGTYPEYEVRNLMMRIIGDGNYERYLDFDDDLNDFIDSLPDYQPNEKDPVEELLYGDPERIELKAQLRELKDKNPENSYEELYEQFLSDWEETDEVSREKKLYDLCVKRKFNREPDKTVISEQKGNTEEKKKDYRIICLGGIIVGIMFMIGVMGSRNKNIIQKIK